MFIRPLYDDPHATADTDELDVRRIPQIPTAPDDFRPLRRTWLAGESFVLVKPTTRYTCARSSPATGPAPMTGAIWEGSQVRRAVADPDRPYHRALPGRPSS